MIENCSGAIDIQRRPKFLRHVSKIDIFAVKLAIAIMKRMHDQTYRYPSILNAILIIAITATPVAKLLSTSVFPCFNISPSTACAAR